MTPILKLELAMNATDISLASSAWFIVFGIMQFPIGSWFDRYGPRRTTFLLLLIGGVGGALLFAFAQTSTQVIIAMAFIGMGCAPILMACYFILAKEFPPQRFSMMAALVIAIGNLGNIFSAEPLAALNELIGWRNLMFGLALLSFVVAILILFILPRRAKADRKSEKNIGSVFDILKLKGFWMLLPLATIAYAIPASIRGLWTGPYLADVYGLSSLGIGEITFWMALAMALGNFFYGPIDSFINSRKWIVFGGCLVTALGLLGVIILPQNNLTLMAIFFVAIGFFGVCFPLLVSHAREFYPDYLIGRGVTLVNFFSVGGVGLMQFLSGQIYKLVEPHYSTVGSFQIIFIFYLVLYLIALAIYGFSQDKKPRP